MEPTTTLTDSRPVLAKRILSRYARGRLSDSQANRRLADLDYEVDVRAWRSAMLIAWDRRTNSAEGLTC